MYANLLIKVNSFYSYLNRKPKHQPTSKENEGKAKEKRKKKESQRT
jgi:hypothetical protein